MDSLWYTKLTRTIWMGPVNIQNTTIALILPIVREKCIKPYISSKWIWFLLFTIYAINDAYKFCSSIKAEFKQFLMIESRITINACTCGLNLIFYLDIKYSFIIAINRNKTCNLFNIDNFKGAGFVNKMTVINNVIPM